MKYVVRLQLVAEDALHEAYLWAARHAPHTASRWLKSFSDAIDSLEFNPERCGFAAEHKRLQLELRQLLFGHRPNVFRVLFLITAQEVNILRSLRAARRRVSRRGLGLK